MAKRVKKYEREKEEGVRIKKNKKIQGSGNET